MTFRLTNLEDKRRRLASRYGVAGALSSSHAVLEFAAEVGDGFAFARWRNAQDRNSYQAPNHHTLSLYLEGGNGTQRIGFPDRLGRPGRFCLLPAGHESHWVLGEPTRFLHFYFEVGKLAALAASIHEADVRETALLDDTFFDDPFAAALLAHFSTADWTDPNVLLAGSGIGHHLLAHVARSRLVRRASPRLHGGLAPSVRRRVLDYIEATLDQPSTHGQLAAVAGVSGYHFARMFRSSVGLPPHAYVLARRLCCARQLLVDSDLSLAEIAAASGFCHQSHLTRHFRAAFGGPPGAWRAAVACVGSR